MTDRLVCALLPTAAHRRERDLHIKLSPSFLLDLEWRCLDRLLCTLAEGFVEEVESFLVAVGR